MFNNSFKQTMNVIVLFNYKFRYKLDHVLLHVHVDARDVY